MNIIERTNAKQKMDMVMKGLSPANPDHVNAYLSGKTITLQEKQERIQGLYGDLPKNLGGGTEKEFRPETNRVYDDMNEIAPTQQSIQKNPALQKKTLNEEMSGYGATSGKTIDGDSLLSFKKPQGQAPGESSFFQEGYNNAKNYINGFVKNIQNQDLKESYKLRKNLFDLIKLCLEGELKYKNNQPAMIEYRKGVMKAEEIFLSKL